MPKHVLTMIAVVAAFFALLWFGVVVLSQTPGRAMLASIGTLFLIGLGVMFTVASSNESSRGRD